MAEYVPAEPYGIQRSVPRTGALALSWDRVGLVAIVVLSALLEFFRLNDEGYANTYYAAAVKSMSENWHNFFFVSFDPGGFVTVDKPPVDLWIQVLSVKLFGFSGVSILLPQALATVLSVLLLFHLVRGTWGSAAGLAAALALALMPVTVATGRNNTMDSMLVLVVLLAAWAAIRATENGRLRWLVLSAVLLGIGFNTKMLEAYLVLPALGLLYLLGSRRAWRVRAAHLAVAAAVLLLVSFSWEAAVDTTPASQRPYVGSSSNNTEMNLILGYNGLNRFQAGLYSGGRSLGGGGGAFGGGHVRFGGGHFGGGRFGGAFSRPGGTGTAANPAANGWFFGTGQPGPTRLLSAALIGQIGWLLPLAFIGLLLAAWQNRRAWPLDARGSLLVLWGMWLLTQVVYFSMASRFQSYYLVMVAPGIAALCGIGVPALWRAFRESTGAWWLLPASLLGLAWYQAQILAPYADWNSRLTPIIAIACVLCAGVLVAARLWHHLGIRAAAAAATVGLASLLVAPGVWAAIPVWNGASSRPVAGPGASTAISRGPDAAQVNQKLLGYLESHRDGAKFLLAVPSAMEAAPYILATGQPIMALGGFSGADTILTPTKLVALVKNDTVRYFLISGGFDGGFGGFGRFAFGSGGADRGASGSSPPPSFSSDRRLAARGGWFGNRGQNAVTTWVTQHCATVNSSLWQSPSNVTPASGYMARLAARGGGLYRCGKTSSA